MSFLRSGSIVLVVLLICGSGAARLSAQTAVPPKAPVAAFGTSPGLQAAEGSASTPQMQRMLDNRETCPLELPSWATEPERYAWSRICLGDIADMSYFKSADAQITVPPETDTAASSAPSPGSVSETGDGAGCVALPPGLGQSDVWPDHRRLSGRFIKLITTRKPYVDIPAYPSIFIRCAAFDSAVDLFHEEVPQRLVLEDSRLPFGLFLQGAHFESDLVLDGSDLSGSDFMAVGVKADGISFQKGRAGMVNLAQATIVNNVNLGGSQIGKQYNGEGVRAPYGLIAAAISVGRDMAVADRADLQKLDLSGASIGGNVNFDTTLVREKANFNGIQVGRSFFMRGGASVAELDLIAARIKTGIELSGLFVVKPPPATPTPQPISTATEEKMPELLTGSVMAGRLTVGDSAFFNDMTVDGQLVLDEANIEGPLYMDRTKVSGPFSAIGIRVEGPLTPQSGAAFKAVSFKGATILGALQVYGSTFDGMFDLRNARLGALELWESGANVSWGAAASLDLRNADIGVLQAQFPENWQLHEMFDALGKPKRLPTRLENLRYDRLGAAAPPLSNSLRPELDVDNLIKWVSDALPQREDTETAGYIPQPFRQLEQTLRSMGAEEQADEVQVAGHVHQIRAYSSDLAGWLRTLADGVWWILVGFGAYPFRVLWWFAALVGIGVIVARWHAPLRARGWTDCFWYSLENAFPLLQPSTDHQKVVHDRVFLRNFFHFQKVAGFVLATILVGALTLLGG